MADRAIGDALGRSGRLDALCLDRGAAGKGDRARLLALALAILLVRGGERVGLTGTRLPPRRGNPQMLRLAEMSVEDDDDDYARPNIAR